MKRIGACIIGATGYGGGELTRLLLQHPEVELVQVTSRSQSGESVGTVHPHLHSLCNLNFTSSIEPQKFTRYENVVIFSALPHGESGKLIAETAGLLGEIRQRKLTVDLSGDFRLTTSALHQQYYPESPWNGELRSKFIYGLPELNGKELVGAEYVANPGCLATAAILSILPVRDLLKGLIALDAKTGSSGAGKELKRTTHHPERHSNYFAYKLLQHQHEPEIAQALRFVSATGEYSKEVSLSFVTQSIPVSRGIYVTAHFMLPEGMGRKEVSERYTEYYKHAPFVRLFSAPPQLQDVVGSNYCDISITVRGDTCVVCAAIDNLVKGMAGQAIQNMNLALGLEQSVGLTQAPLRLI